MQSQAANVQITEDNFVACECGNIHLLPLYIAGKVESPLVGQKPIISLVGVTTFKCLLCGKQWDINESKNVSEWKKPKIMF
jgi:hypothetical protein